MFHVPCHDRCGPRWSWGGRRCQPGCGTVSCLDAGPVDDGRGGHHVCEAREALHAERLSGRPNDRLSNLFPQFTPAVSALSRGPRACHIHALRASSSLARSVRLMCAWAWMHRCGRRPRCSAVRSCATSLRRRRSSVPRPTPCAPPSSTPRQGKSQPGVQCSHPDCCGRGVKPIFSGAV